MMYDDVIHFIAPQASQNSAAQLLAARYDDEFTCEPIRGRRRRHAIQVRADLLLDG